MKKKLRHISSLIIVFAVFLIHLAAEPIATAEPLIIGIAHSERYPYATMMKNSFEMALEVINTGGGIKGQPLKLVYADDQSQPKPGEKSPVGPLWISKDNSHVPVKKLL